MVSFGGRLIRLILQFRSSASGPATWAVQRNISDLYLRLIRLTDSMLERFSDARDDFLEHDLRHNLRFIPEQTSPLGLHMMRSSNRVLAVATIRCLQWVLSRVVGYRCSPNVVIAALILVPSALVVLHEPITGANACDMLGMFLYYGLLITILYGFPKYAWLRLIATSDDLDKVFASEGDKKIYIHRVDQWLGIARQSSFGVFCVLLSLVTLYLVTPYMTRIPVYGNGRYFIAGLLTWLEANSVYWLWGVPQIIGQLRRMPILKLSILSPAYTPAFISLSRLLGTCALMAAFGMLVTVAPVLLYTLRYGSWEALMSVVIVASAGMCTVLFIGLAPQLWLAEAAQRHKEQSLQFYCKNNWGLRGSCAAAD